MRSFACGAFTLLILVAPAAARSVDAPATTTRDNAFIGLTTAAPAAPRLQLAWADTGNVVLTWNPKGTPPTAEQCRGTGCSMLMLSPSKTVNGPCTDIWIKPGSGGPDTTVDLVFRKRGDAPGTTYSAQLSTKIYRKVPDFQCLALASGPFTATRVDPVKPQAKPVSARIAADPAGYLGTTLPPLLAKGDRGGACKAVHQVLTIKPGNAAAIKWQHVLNCQ